MKHKFVLDEEHYKEYHRSLLDIRQLFYEPKCKVCGKFDPFMAFHIAEKLIIPKFKRKYVRRK